MLTISTEDLGAITNSIEIELNISKPKESIFLTPPDDMEGFVVVQEDDVKAPMLEKDDENNNEIEKEEDELEEEVANVDAPASSPLTRTTSETSFDQDNETDAEEESEEESEWETVPWEEFFEDRYFFNFEKYRIILHNLLFEKRY